MLRIHRTGHDGDDGFVLEGKLVGPWVTECRAVLARAAADGAAPHLDLSAVHFADPAGIALLEELEAAGRIRARSPFLAALLQKEERP
jgi:ABC-type transporter Mla MlaB component